MLVKRMSDANFVAFFVVYRFWVEMSWAFSGMQNAVVGPLVQFWEGDKVAKEIFIQLAGGYVLVGEKEGRATPKKTRTFDSTMGFPGEDVAKQPQN